MWYSLPMKTVENIVLIGMPGAGKSTVGVVLAKQLGMDFLDTDLLIQKQERQTLQELIDSRGNNAFREVENRTLSAVAATQTVIATGGSAIYGDEAMRHLGENGVIVFLQMPLPGIRRRLGNASRRGIAMEKGQTLESLFAERDSLYRKWADVVVCVQDRTIQEAAEEVAAAVRPFFPQDKK